MPSDIEKDIEITRKRSSERDWAEFCLNQLKIYYNCIKNIDDDDMPCNVELKAFALLNSSVFGTWDSFNRSATTFLRLMDGHSIEDIISALSIQRDYSILKGQYDGIFCLVYNQLTECAERWETVWGAPKPLEFRGKIDDFQNMYGQPATAYIRKYPNDLTELTDDGDIILEGKIFNSSYKKICDNILKMFVPAMEMERCLSGYFHSLVKLEGQIDPQNIVEALASSFRAYYFTNYREVVRIIKRQIQNFKDKRNQETTSEMWDLMLKAEDELYQLAINKKLTNSSQPIYAHIKEDDRNALENNSQLLEIIKKYTLDDELFDFHDAIYKGKLLKVLTKKNLSIFHNLLLRRTIITCNLFPKLKEHIDNWWYLNSKTITGNTSKNTNLISETRQKKLNGVLAYTQKGNWDIDIKTKIEKWIKTILGVDAADLDDKDKIQTEKVWKLLESGHGDRIEIFWGYILGHLREAGIIKDQPKALAETFFASSAQRYQNNINKGKSANACNGLKDVIPFISNYRIRIFGF